MAEKIKPLEFNGERVDGRLVGADADFRLIERSLRYGSKHPFHFTLCGSWGEVTRRFDCDDLRTIREWIDEALEAEECRAALSQAKAES